MSYEDRGSPNSAGVLEFLLVLVEVVLVLVIGLPFFALLLIWFMGIVAVQVCVELPALWGSTRHKLAHWLHCNACKEHSRWVGNDLLVGHKCVKCGRLYRAYRVQYRRGRAIRRSP